MQHFRRLHCVVKHEASLHKVCPIDLRLGTALQLVVLCTVYPVHQSLSCSPRLHSSANHPSVVQKFVGLLTWCATLLFPLLPRCTTGKMDSRSARWNFSRVILERKDTKSAWSGKTLLFQTSQRGRKIEVTTCLQIEDRRPSRLQVSFLFRISLTFSTCSGLSTGCESL